MKRTLILLIILAISVTMATSTFAVYTLTLPTEQIDVGNKVFNLFSNPPYEVTEPRFIEDAPTWLFKIFTSTNSSTRRNLYVNVAVTSQATTGLSVSLLDSTGSPLASANFSGSDHVQLFVNRYVRTGAGNRINRNVSLAFTYYGNPISAMNTPFAIDSVHYTVEAYARTAAEEAADEGLTIDEIIADHFFHFNLLRDEFDIVISDDVSLASSGATVPFERDVTILDDPLHPEWNYATGDIKIECSISARTLTVSRAHSGTGNYVVLHTYTDIDLPADFIPSELVLCIDGFSNISTFSLTNLVVNGISRAFNLVPDGSDQAQLVEQVASTTDTYVITFSYETRTDTGFPEPYTYFPPYDFDLYLALY
jgi:hypothetical protein